MPDPARPLRARPASGARAGFAALACAAGVATAAERPIAGKRLELRAHATQPARRSFAFASTDPSLAPPFADPTRGASLRVGSGDDATQCRAEIALDPLHWQPIAGDGPGRGYRYRDASGDGRVAIVYAPGRIRVRIDGAAWPCDRVAPAHATPLPVELRIHRERYCAAFGGDIAVNAPGRFRARRAPAPRACDADVTAAQLNILHGLFCPPDTASCRFVERAELFAQWAEASGCPDVLTLQEVNVLGFQDDILQDAVEAACPYHYRRVAFPVIGVSEQIILSRFPVQQSEQLILHSFLSAAPRNATYARIDHPVGPLDVVSTHFAAGVDQGSGPCDIDNPPGGDIEIPCPAACRAAGATTIRDCQAVQLAQFVESRHDVATPAVVAGDFNARAGSFAYEHFTERGWIDVHLAAGNPECDPDSGTGCTSGRDETSGENPSGDLESPEANVRSRIDFIFVVPPAAGSDCAGGIDPFDDADGDFTATRIFADDPNPFAPGCGPLPAAICWPSDHEGVELDLNCD
ncbi:MAG: endonuclease/exonuclease/phosphatase family protein [Deltaproteobacteria bacterium]|nr:MAG: endonuclease/exonuclease/phosphatase family protein [Deltaproteobacteria bacterium]